MNGITNAMRLFATLSYFTTKHFADKMNISPIDLCEMIVRYQETESKDISLGAAKTPKNGGY